MKLLDIARKLVRNGHDGSSAPLPSMDHYCQIDENALSSLSMRLAARAEFPVNGWLAALGDRRTEIFTSLSFTNRCFLLLVFHAIGFCYFVEPRWRYQGIDGAKALLTRLCDDKDLKGLDLVLTAFDLRAWLGGTGTLPLMAERAAHLREIVNGVTNSGGREQYLHYLLVGENPETMHAFALAESIAAKLTCYRDSVQVTPELSFAPLKRAQLLVSDLVRIAGADTTCSVVRSRLAAIDLSTLTGFADYKLPQILRAYGVLQYGPALAACVDQQIFLPTNGPQEIAIRAATIVAVDQIAKRAHMRACDVDAALWLESQTHVGHLAPYHRVLTTAY